MEIKTFIEDIKQWKKNNIIIGNTHFGNFSYPKISILCDGMSDVIGIDDYKDNMPIKHIIFINQKNHKTWMFFIHDIISYKINKDTLILKTKKHTETIR